jgi:hypothetical protein
MAAAEGGGGGAGGYAGGGLATVAATMPNNRVRVLGFGGFCHLRT